VEWLGPYGSNFVLTKISKIISNLSQGVVTNYALYILIGICFYISVNTFMSTFFDTVNSYTISSVLILLAISYYIGLSVNKNSIDLQSK
jgi:hypothetical protein